MTTAINTRTCANAAKPGVSHISLQSRIDQAILGLRKLLLSTRHKIQLQDDPWADAVHQVQHLDHHVLKDIGAPTWVIDEVDRRQRGHDILDSKWKW